MKRNNVVMNVLAGICLTALAGTAHAGDAALNLKLPYTFGADASAVSAPYANNAPYVNSQPFLLALNEGEPAKEQAAAPATPAAGSGAKPEFKPPFFTGSNAHKYFGLGTILFAGLTALTAPGEGCETNCTNQPARKTSGTPHTRFARATGILAAATVTTGLLSHWDDVHVADGFSDPDNQHALLGGAGALLMMYAINKSMKSAVPTSHAGIAELGGVAMAVAVKISW